MHTSGRVGTAIRVVTLSACLLAAVSADGSGSTVVRNAGSSVRERLAQYVTEALQPVSGAARIDFYEPHSCGQGGFVTFPRMELHKPLGMHVGVSGMRDIFSAYRDAFVTQRGAHLVVVRIGVPANALLTTPIESLEFSEFARYNAFLAISRIMGSKAVQSAAAKVNLVLGPGILIGAMAPPMPGLPHLPRKIQHITLDEALDRVAITFAGAVVYSLCTDDDGSRRPQVYFIKIGE